MWDELGIAPCNDPKAIRRAYAARLKQLDPDREPDAFARLRKAYERALDASLRVGRTGAEQHASTGDDAHDDAHGAAHDDAYGAAHHNAAAERSSTRAATSAADQVAALERSRAAVEQDDIRDRALLIALEAALREGDAEEAIALYYRAAATGALPLAGASDLIERLVAVAIDDTTLDAAGFRRLIRIVGLDASRTRAPVNSALRARALARLAADDWYDNLLAKAQSGRGQIARRQRKIARLMLGRIGRRWHPRVDRAALRTWLAQYRTHAAWLSARIDPAWVGKLEARLRRRQIALLVFYILFIGSMLMQFMLVTVVGVSDDDSPLWPLTIGLLLVAFFLWIFILLVKELLKLVFPRWTGLAGIAGPRDLARSGRALWERLRAKASGGR